MSDKEYSFTVFTATYNRGHTLHRAYESLKAQTFRDFEWIIGDDGSTDGTEAIVRKWQEEADFPIHYFWMEHGGKHFVFNRGVREARGEYFAPVDSDNAIIPETLERLYYYWKEIPEAQRKRYYVIHTFCRNEHGNMIGNFFERSPFDSSLRKFTFSGHHHEMWPCFRSDVIKQFPFQEDIRGYYIAETTVWHEMDKKYQARFVNDVLCVYYQDVPSITRQPRHPMQNLVGVRIAILYILNNDLDFFPDQPCYFLRAAMNFSRFSFHYNISLFKQYASLSNFFAKFLWLINLPIATCVFLSDVLLDKTPKAAEKKESIVKILVAITNCFNGFEDSLRSRLLRNSFVVGLGITFARLLAALLQISVAAHFGTSKTMDAYILAYAFAIFLQSILAGSLRTAVIPIFIHTKQNKGREAGQLISDGLLGITLTGGLLLAVVTVLLAPFVLRLIPGLDPEAQRFTLRFIIYLSPLLVLQALSGIGGGLLQAENYFKAPSVAIASGAFITLSFFLLLVNTMKIYALIIGVLLGAVAEAAITGYAMHMRGYKFQFRIRGNSELIKKIFNAYWPVALGAFVISFSPLIGQIMSAGLGSGSVSSLGYSQRIPQFFLGIIVIILGQTVMPEFSKITASGDFEALKSVLNKLNTLLMKFTIPTVAMLMIFSHYLTGIIFEHGRFTHEDTSLVSYVQIFYFMQIPAYIMGIVYTQALTALRAKRFFFWSSFYVLIGTIAGNMLFMRYLGLAGISLNAALLSWSIVVISYFYILMILKNNQYKSALMS